SQERSIRAITVVRNMRILMHPTANAVTAVPSDDPVSTRCRVGFHRMADFPKPVSCPGCLQPYHQRSLGIIKQTTSLPGNGPYRVSPGRITVPTIQNRADIYGDDVSILQRPWPGNAMHDLLIDRGTNISPEAVISQETRNRPMFFHGI